MPEAHYLDDMWEGEIVVRDRYQFELKSLYSPTLGQSLNTYKLEFYFFLPSALQVNSSTYTRQDFYQDLTGLIRFKTPEFTIRELIHTSNPRSPIYKISQKLKVQPEDFQCVEQELKLLGNVIRSILRDRVKAYLDEFDPRTATRTAYEINEEIATFLRDVGKLREIIIAFVADLLERHPESPWKPCLQYVDEFISLTLETYLTRLLQEIREFSATEFDHSDQLLQLLIAAEVKYRETHNYISPLTGDEALNTEARTYRTGLLKKYVLDVLLLSTERQELISIYRHVFGSIAAGIAMFVYMILFVWQGNVFVINSIPFVVITTLIYILKDRMKDILNTVSARKAFEWYPDYQTEIHKPEEGEKIGTLTESFSFFKESQLHREILEARYLGAQREVPEATRKQKVFYYKRKVEMHTGELLNGARRFELNDIFRFSVGKFLQKASDPTEEHISLDLETGTLVRHPSPKVYHLNVVLKKTYSDQDLEERVEYKKYRVILDKDGIKRVERLSATGTMVLTTTPG